MSGLRPGDAKLNIHAQSYFYYTQKHDKINRYWLDTHSLIVSTFFRIVGPRTRIGTEIQTTAGRKRSQITLTRS